MIDPATKDRILEAAQIVDVVSEFVTLRKRGVNYVGLCPFHADKNPSFYVSPAKNLCKCFACGEGGSPVYFIMKHEQLSYPDALRYLAKKYHIEIRERELTDEERRAQGDRESMFILNNWAQKYFTSCLMEHEEGRTIGLSYFAQRGFREETIRKFQLGYGLEARDALYRAAMAKGFKREYLEKTGFDTVRRIEQELVNYALPKLREIPFVELYGCDADPALKTGIITFNVKDVHPHDVATILDSFGVAVRAGHHCAQPLMKYLGQNATCRASFYLYNTKADVDRWLEALKEVRKVMHL